MLAFEKCLREPPVKQILKIYKILLQWFTEDEHTKEYTIKWALDFKVDIEWDLWEFLWKKYMQISPSTVVKENCLKMFTRWYITPKK